MTGCGESGKEGTEESREAEEGRRRNDEENGHSGWVVKKGGDGGAGGRHGQGLLELQVSEHHLQENKVSVLVNNVLILLMKFLGWKS